MRKKDSAVNAYIDCNKWATKLNTRFSSAEKSEKLNYKEMLGIYAEFSDELTLVRRLVSARVYEELFAITKMPGVYGEWNVKQIGAEIGMDATKMSRLKEPEDGALTSVDRLSYAFRLQQTASRLDGCLKGFMRLLKVFTKPHTFSLTSPAKKSYSEMSVRPSTSLTTTPPFSPKSQQFRFPIPCGYKLRLKKCASSTSSTW